ncbi:MAG: retron-type reverse transcriptase [Arenicella sp.]|jgi:retron-type reverse transcriptase
MELSVQGQFSKAFSKAELETIFIDNISTSNARGIDNVSAENFEKNLEKKLTTISKKVNQGTYNFTKYKLKLISKGRGKVPRELSIPSIRDRVTLRALCNFLIERFSKSGDTQLPQFVVKK